jgi:hypothetical protein
MYTSTALLTALSLVLGYLPGITDRTPTTPIAASTEYELLDRGSYTDDEGREITYAVWVEDGELQADVSIFDPATRDSLEMWVDCETFRFEGVIAGEPFSGAEPASTFFDTNPDAPTCVGWVALVCLGAALILSSGGCSMLEGCDPKEPTEVPGGGGGVPGGGEGEEEEGESEGD